MAFFKKLQSRNIQRKANSFVKSLKNKSEKEIEQCYLDNKEFENNEIVLSYLFFKYPSLIRILPIDFQKSRINSNLSMFRYGSTEAIKELISDWLKNNKFFMNANVVQLTDEEYSTYLRMYFQQPEDVAKLYMEDLRKTIQVLSSTDIKATENVIKKIKDDFTDRQWEFVIDANPMFIKYASQNIQNKYCEDEKYNKHINGPARKTFIESQMSKIKEDITILNSMPIDVQKEYINEYPYMINTLDDNTLLELLKYDIDLVKYINFPSLRSKTDKSQEIVFGLLGNIENKTTKEIINIAINKGLFNAKGKLYRYDSKSNDNSYQYTKRAIKVIQKLDVEQIVSLIMIDVNYVLPYVVPVYDDNSTKEEKEKITIDCNSRCLNLFKIYYGVEIYNKYYKVINKIYNEYLSKIDKYDYTKDYNCIFDLLKVLFNKTIITKNNIEKITVFIGMSLLYKGSKIEGTKVSAVKLLNEILQVAYDKPVKNDKEIYELNCLEIYDERLSFIPQELLYDYVKYNFVNISSLLFICKAKKVVEYFKTYYFIMSNIYGNNKETLFKSVENFQYYLDLLKDIDGKELSNIEIDNLVDVIASSGNSCDINKKEDLDNFDIVLLKKLIRELSAVKDEDVYRNLLCNYLFNKGYDQKGNTGLLEVDTIKQICDIYDSSTLSDFEIDGKKVFTQDEVNLFTMISLMFNVKDFDLLLSYIEKFIEKKVKRNIISITNFFSKLKKYRTELINDQIVSIDEIELLYSQKPDVVKKEIKNDVQVYTVINQDFKVLCSTSNDGIHYLCTNVSNLDKNCYAYNKLVKTGSVRFTTYEDKTLVKINKDNRGNNLMKVDFILVVNSVNDELLKIARNNNLKIVVVQEDN